MFLASSVIMSETYSCGSLNFAFSGTFPYLINMVITLIKIVVPILLIIFGMLDLGKAVVAAKEEEIKKGQQTLIKRAISAVIVFFVIQLVQLIMSFVSNSNADVLNCLNCFVNAEVKDNSCKISE